jgi:hypothetical protein
MEALQNLGVTLVPPTLKTHAAIKSTRTHRPIFYSGGFVMTAPIQPPNGTGSKLALRMFYKLPDDMEQRYRLISKFVQQHAATGIFANVSFIDQGIRVKGQVYPICTMDWLEGETLRSYLSKNITDPSKIQPLAEGFRAMMKALTATGGAHGDLSHENIMVVNGKLMLVDYDGMFIPGMALPPVVAGQKNFQHPGRITQKGFFGAYQDNFSAIVIYLSLLALQHKPDLYDTFTTGENIILSKQDFDTPDTSKVLAQIAQITSLTQAIEGFKAICKGDVLQVPSLEEFLKGRRSVTQAALSPVAAAILDQFATFNDEGLPILNATSPNMLVFLSAQGQTVTLAGRVHQATLQADCVRLEFNSGTEIASVVIIEGDGFKKLKKKGQTEINTYSGAWVRVTGTLEMNTINGHDVPAIVTESLQDIAKRDRISILALIGSGDESASTSQAPLTGGSHDYTSSQKAVQAGRPNTGNADNLFKNKPSGGFGSLTDD